MDVPLIKFLTKAGAEHHIPSFARHKVVSISDLIPLGTEDLRRIGVFEIAVQNNILRSVSWTRGLLDSDFSSQINKLLEYDLV